MQITPEYIQSVQPQLAAAAEQAQRIKSGEYLTSNPTGQAVNFNSGTSGGGNNVNAENGAKAGVNTVASSLGLGNAVLNNIASGNLTPVVRDSSGSVVDYYAGTQPSASYGGTGSSYGGTVSGSGYGVPAGNANAYGATVSGNVNAYGSPTDYNAQIARTIADLEAQYRNLYDRQANGDYTKSPYFQTIMEQYGIKGDNAANAEKASSAGSNAGNLDSYAAANARRQQLAYKNAAQTAALNAYNSEIANMLQTLQSLGVNVNDLYATWSGDLNSQRDAQAALYGYDTERYKSDNQYKSDVYGYDTDRYKSDNTLAGQKYVSDNSLLSDYYGYDTERYKSDNALLSDKLGYEVDLAKADLDADTQLRVQSMVNEIRAYEAELALEEAKGNNASKERIADLEARSNEAVQRLKNDLGVYQSDSDYRSAVARYGQGGETTGGNGGTSTTPTYYETVNDGTAKYPEQPGKTNDYAASLDERKAAEPHVIELARIGRNPKGLQSDEAINYIADLAYTYGFDENLIKWIVNEAGARMLQDKGPGEDTEHQKIGSTSTVTERKPYYATDLAGIEPYIQEMVDAVEKHGWGSDEYKKAYNAVAKLNIPHGLVTEAVLETSKRYHDGQRKASGNTTNTSATSNTYNPDSLTDSERSMANQLIGELYNAFVDARDNANYGPYVELYESIANRGLRDDVMLYILQSVKERTEADQEKIDRGVRP